MKPLAAILKHAKAHCRFYERDDIQVDNLETFPVINRRVLQSNLAQLIASAETERERLLDCLNGAGISEQARMRSEFQFSSNIYIEQTSGSSGVPLRLPKTRAERCLLGLAAWRCRLRIDPLVKVDTFVPLFHRALDTPLPVSPFESSAVGVRAFYEWLASHKARWIHAPPGLVGYHAQMLKAMGASHPAPSLKFFESSGSSPDPMTIKTIEEVIGSTVVNQYGTRESWAIGYTLGTGHFQINDDAVLVELLDNSDQPISEDGIEGDVAVTSKVLELLPIIRYKTGDRGSWTTRWESGSESGKRLLSLSIDRDINMVFFNGRWISGNILLKDVLHKIDHKIGYGYCRFMQVRRISAMEVKLIIADCKKADEVHRELQAFYKNVDSRVIVILQKISADDGERLAERKPYLFINEYDPPGRIAE